VRGAPLDVLRKASLFAELNQRELQRVARLFKARTFRAGQTVVQEGSGGAAFFVIESGEATVAVAGKKKTTLKPGDYFGEIALIDEGKRMATITANTEMLCYGLTYWDFKPAVKKNGTLGWKLLQGMAKLLREARES
jgi:CRP-like cAMP-binding protein